MQKIFPIKSDLGCLLKWSWSTVYVYQSSTNSCHRTGHSYMKPGEFHTFHNTPEKLEARTKMLNNEWPGHGCEYCRDIEASGGMSDRLTQIKLVDESNGTAHLLVSPELKIDDRAIVTTPTMLEIYFSNKCNMSCIYCSPTLSSLWVQENKVHGEFFGYTFDQNDPKPDKRFLVSHAESADQLYDSRLAEFWEWFKNNYKTLQVLHILGGEPFYQDETEQMIDFLLASDIQPGIQIKFFSNLKVNFEKFTRLITKMKRLQDEKQMRVGIIASLDCWGPEAEYIRSGLNLEQFDKNFSYMVNECPWLEIIVNSTISSLSIKAMPALVRKLNEWRLIHPITNSFNLLTAPEQMNPSIFPSGFFDEDLKTVLSLMPRGDQWVDSLYDYLEGVVKSINNSSPFNPLRLIAFRVFLDKMDKRKKTNWRETFPWLVPVIDI